MNEPLNYVAQAEAVFRRMLSKGGCVAFEDALRAVISPEGFDRRCFGHIPARMKRNGEIVEAGFRVSESPGHNSGIKRLWKLADATGGEQ